MNAGMRRVGGRAALAAVAFAVVFLVPGWAQMQPRTTDGTTIVSDPPGAEVYRGDTVCGRTPMEIVLRDADTVSVWYPSRRDWDAQCRKVSRPAPRSNEGVVRLLFRVNRYINSVPTGAVVLAGDSVLGTTPLRLRVDDGERRLTLRYPGHDDATVVVARDGDESVFTELTRRDGRADVGGARDATPDLRLPPAGIVIPAATGLTAGVLSAIFKFEADRSYKRYTGTGDRALLDRARRYDIYAGVALAVLEVATAWIVYELMK